MKTILCYGDSNTWGYDPKTKDRHRYEDRWTTLLQKRLGPTYLVIPEGLNGRTTVWDDPIEGDKNGRTYLLPCLESHKPLDVVVILLGTNDLKVRFSLPASDIAAGVGVLVDLVCKSGVGPLGEVPKVLVLVPPEVRQLSDFQEMFAGSRETSLVFPRAFAAMAEEKGVRCLDIGQSVRFSDIDGIHFEAEELPKLADLVAETVLGLLP